MRSGKCYETITDSVGRHVSAVARACLRSEMIDVTLDRARRDPQFRGDLLRGKAFDDELEHLDLA
jgi:hypothetical protein